MGAAEVAAHDTEMMARGFPGLGVSSSKQWVGRWSGVLVGLKPGRRLLQLHSDQLVLIDRDLTSLVLRIR